MVTLPWKFTNAFNKLTVSLEDKTSVAERSSIRINMEDPERPIMRRIKRKHPQDIGNFFSHFFFCWQLRIFVKGLKKCLTEDELYAPLKAQESKSLGDRLEKLWGKEQTSKNPSLWRPLIKMFGLEFIMYGMVIVPVNLSISILQPYFLKNLLDCYIRRTDKEQAYIYACSILLLCVLRIFSYHKSRFGLTLIGMKIRIACSSLIYRHFLKLKKISFETVTIGKIVNLLSNDVSRFDRAFLFLHSLWSAPIELLLTAYYLDVTLGHTALVGYGIIIASLSLNVFLSKKIKLVVAQTAVKTDHRIHLMNDVLCGIKFIKMCSWEQSFQQLIGTARKLETKEIFKANILRVLNVSIKIWHTPIALFLNILTAILAGMPPTPQYIFVTASAYKRLKFLVARGLPRAVINISEAALSMKRVENFLKVEIREARSFSETIGVYAKDITVKWHPNHSNDTLKEVSFTAFPGKLVGVIGAAGSGKSTLLQLILGEIELKKGTLHVGGALSYASQEPWIFSASVKQNILFGAEMDQDKYLKVIRVCALEHDLARFPFGDSTLVGERGVMLSGGQKARINLARAIYRDADVYLLDDPLSAVDSQVAKQIFDECILGYLKEKCVVLVTHQVQFLRDIKKVYKLEAGKIFVREIQSSFNEKNGLDAPEAKPMMSCGVPGEIKEHKSSGSNVKNIYKNYILAGGNWKLTGAVLFLLILIQLLSSTIDYFIFLWVNLEQEPTNFEVKLKWELKTNSFLCIYSALTIFLIIITYKTMLSFVQHSKTASKRLHNRMLTRVIHGSMTFFNFHSSGRILNRFSQDIRNIDEKIPVTLLELILIFVYFIGVNVVVSILNYWMLLPSLVLVFTLYSYHQLFHPIIKNVKRTERINRSPIYSHLTASFQGLTTIRALRVQKRLEGEFDDHQNLHTSVSYMALALHSCLAFWVDMTCAVYTALVIFGFLLGRETKVGNVGMAITQVMLLLRSVQYGMRNWTNLDNQMISVERVLEYSELKQEIDDGGNFPPEPWPSEGNIELQSVSMRYSPDNPMVLQNVSFKVRGGEKVGIVGRTGAGKTSLISTLFRLFDFNGTITIDGVDIKSIPLKTLRSKISIVPQDPVLFLGTLRKNLDPFNKFTDLQIWNALEDVGLKEVVADLPLGLKYEISESGSNFSVGQKQLLCLVRTMLRKAKIVVLDEATANVDLKTDKVIQSAIRRRFRGCTVLTIAHRLSTIMDSDRILVMNNGRVREFDQARKFMEYSDGFPCNFVN